MQKKDFKRIFLFKIYLYILNDDKLEYMDKIKKIYNEKSLRHKEFINYFEKNWINSSFVNFDLYDNENFIFRINNFVNLFLEL